MFRKINVSLENLTPELAAEIASMEPKVLGERILKGSHTAYLLDLLRAGRFASPNWSVAIDKSTGRKYRVDGQHSSFMLSHLPDDVPFPMGLNATISTWEMDTIDDAHRMFDIFDAPFCVRNNVDYMGMIKAEYADLADLDSSLLVQLANGIDMWLATRPQGAHLRPRYRGEELYQDPENRRFAVWASKFRTETIHVAEVNSEARVLNPQFLSKLGVVTELYGAYRANPEQADRFWCLTFTEAHPDPDHESRELARVIKEMISKPHAKTDQYRTKVSRFWKRYLRMSDEVSGSTGSGSLFAAEETAEEAPVSA